MTADKLQAAKKSFCFHNVDFACGPARTDLCLPQNFIGHPIAYAGKTILHEQHRLDRRFAASFEKVLHERKGKFFRENGDRLRGPPVRRIFPGIETNPAKLSRIVEDQGLFLLPQNKVVMLSACED